MKITNIVITNIASLRKTHSIDFQNILKDESIFAITGPTGSGKSTILAAISLALYGKSYKSLRHHDFITLGSSQGSIELYFETAGEKYCAYWECRVSKKDGDPLNKPIPKRELYHIDGVEKTALDYNAEAILDLNFDQFCKCVILNQGEFAQFLMSSFSERKDILEKLYDRETLAKISKFLRSDLKDLKSEIDKLETILIDQNTYSDQEIENIKTEIKINSANLGIIKEYYGLYKDCAKHIDSIIDHINKIDAQQNRKTNYKKEVDQNTQKLNEIKTTETIYSKDLEELEELAAGKIPQLRIAIQNNQRINHLNEMISEFQSAITKRTANIATDKKTIINLNQQDEQLTQKLNNNKSQAEVIFKTENELAQIKELVASSIALKQTIELKDQKYKSVERELIKSSSNLLNLKDQLKKIKENIEDVTSELKIVDNEPSTFFSTKTNEINNQISDLKLELQRANRIILDSKKSQTHLQSIEKHITKLEEQALANNIKANQIKTELENNIEIVETNQLLHSVKICIEEGLKKEKCLVCQRPFDKNMVDPKLWVEKDVSRNQQNIKDLNESLNNIKIMIEKEENNTKLQKSQYEITLKDIQLAKQSFQNIPLIANHHLDLNDPSIQEQMNSSFQKILKGLIDELERIKQIERQFIEESKMISSISESILKEEHEQLSLNQLFETTKTNLSLTSEKLDSHLTSIIQAYNKYNIILNNDFQTIIDTVKNDEKHFNEIKNLTIQKESILKERNQLIKNITILEIENGENLKKVNDLDNEIKQLKSSNNTIVGEDNPLELLSIIEKSLEISRNKRKDIQGQRHKAELEMNDAKKGLEHTIEQIKDLETMLNLTIKHLMQTTQQHPKITLPPLDQLSDNQIELIHKGFNKIICGNNNLIDIQNGTIQVRDLLQHCNAILKSNIEKIKEHIIQYQTRIDEYNKIQDKLNKLNDSLKDKKKNYNRLNNLFQIMGKDEFRNFALGLIEQQLVLFANGELNNLCDGRYELIHEIKDKSQELDFFIMDKYRGGLKRKVSTLSGGETFLVSLALALALAEMTRGKTEIDSFFIDEGFGSLDLDAIEDALNLLLSIQSRGKQIGIISHVKSLTDRIPININLTKSNLGDSSISYTHTIL